MINPCCAILLIYFQEKRSRVPCHVPSKEFEKEGRKEGVTGIDLDYDPSDPSYLPSCEALPDLGSLDDLGDLGNIGSPAESDLEFDSDGNLTAFKDISDTDSASEPGDDFPMIVDEASSDEGAGGDNQCDSGYDSQSQSSGSSPSSASANEDEDAAYAEAVLKRDLPEAVWEK